MGLILASKMSVERDFSRTEARGGFKPGAGPDQRPPRSAQLLEQADVSSGESARATLQMRELSTALVLAHEEEQRRIARELHDQIGQDLTALKITLNRGKNASLDEARQTLHEAAALTEELLQTVRSICSALRPPVLEDLGLFQAIQWHIKTFSARTGLDIAFEAEDIDETCLSPIVQSTTFRVIQEALTNVSRHAETKTAAVTLRMTEGAVVFSIRDNGRGFNVGAAQKRSSTGLSGMRERLLLVHGRFEIASSPGNGTTVHARIPVISKKLNDSQTNRIQHGKGTPN
jgi:signal transduction histidine kinase